MIVWDRHKTVDIDSLLPEIKFEFPELPQEMFRYYVRKVSRQMSMDGNLLRSRVVIPVQYGVYRYRLDPPDGSELLRILRLYHDNNCGTHDVIRFYNKPVSDCHLHSYAYYDDYEREIYINTDYIGGAYNVVISVMPASDSCVLPLEFSNIWLEALLTGVRGELFSIAGRAWSNPQQGFFLKKQCRDLTNSLALDKLTHNNNGAIKMNFGKVM